MSSPTRSAIWTYFKPDENDQSKAHCKICNKTYSRKGRTTTSLKNHLKSMHPEEFNLFESSHKEKQFQKIKADAEKVVTPLQEAKKQLSLEEVVLKEKKLIQELAPRYNFRERFIFTDFVCKELYGKVAEKVKQLIEKFDYMSFTSDIWSDPSSNASLLSLTCHGISENFDKSSIVLKCETFDDHHTGDITAEKFDTMLSEWNI
ncbi:hypothetical protein ILUMI_01751 [Ignelater luminosus]|uniref:BED-type domain-containing protein n=1 Tax=Ignelater luminosus TaxID=2038154 RepID=A0A8K0GLY7_IGNLU|nr:hypothetical protein ILUMI_01751 [Ignelater luminosus]